jgi:hypothetical protein
LDRFDALISKIIFKKIKKHHFDVFRHEKHFEKQPQPLPDRLDGNKRVINLANKPRSLIQSLTLPIKKNPAHNY